LLNNLRASGESFSSKSCDLPVSFALSSPIKRGDLGIEVIVRRYASISRVDACGFADTFCEAFPICIRWHPPYSSKRVNARIIKDAWNIGGCDGLS